MELVVAMGTGDAAVHRERKKKILKENPEIFTLIGSDSRTQYYGYAVFSLQLFICYMVHKSYLLALLFGFTVAPYIDQGVLVLIHEVSHNLVFSEGSTKSPKNRLLGILCNIVMLVPISEIFRQHHNIHHYTLGSMATDVDVPMRSEVRFVGNSRILKLLWLAFNIFVLPARSMQKLPVVWSFFMVLNWVTSIGFGLLLLFNYPPACVYLLLGTILSQSIHPSNARQVQRHIRQFKDEREDAGAEGKAPVALHNTKINTFSYYGPQNTITLNVGYHVEHHDFANISWTRLPELRKIAGEKWYPTNYAYNSRGIFDIMRFVLDDDITLAGFADNYLMD